MSLDVLFFFLDLEEVREYVKRNKEEFNLRLRDQARNYGYFNKYHNQVFNSHLIDAMKLTKIVEELCEMRRGENKSWFREYSISEISQKDHSSLISSSMKTRLSIKLFILLNKIIKFNLINSFFWLRSFFEMTCSITYLL